MSIPDQQISLHRKLPGFVGPTPLKLLKAYIIVYILKQKT